MIFSKIISVLACLVAVQANPIAENAFSWPTTTSIALPGPTGAFALRFNKPGAINLSKNKTLHDEIFRANGLPVLPVDTITAAPVNGTAVALQPRAGACDQGTCPDYFQAFDTMFTYISITSAPDNRYDSASTIIRINDCGVCQSHQTSASLFGPSGGCWDFSSCGRNQQICTDTNNNRGHRIWKDTGTKTCYSYDFHDQGGCGFIIIRWIWSAARVVACNW